MSAKVKACPKCGREFVHHCWHGDEVPTVEMDVEAALKLLDVTIRGVEQELERLKFDRDNYKRMI